MKRHDGFMKKKFLERKLDIYPKKFRQFLVNNPNHPITFLEGLLTCLIFWVIGSACAYVAVMAIYLTIIFIFIKPILSILLGLVIGIIIAITLPYKRKEGKIKKKINRIKERRKNR